MIIRCLRFRCYTYLTERWKPMFDFRGKIFSSSAIQNNTFRFLTAAEINILELSNMQVMFYVFR
jgi:hypothetical protein